MTVKRGKLYLSKQVIPRRREWIGYEFWFSLFFSILLLFDDFNDQFIPSTLLTPYTRIWKAFLFNLGYHFCASRRTAISPDGQHVVTVVQYTTHMRIHSPRIRDVDGTLKITYGCCVVTNMSATISECSILLQVKPDPKCSMPMRIVKVLLYNLRTRQRSETNKMWEITLTSLRPLIHTS